MSLGRNESKHISCKYSGCEDECPKTCSKCAIFIKSDGDHALSINDLDGAIRQYKKAIFVEPRFAEAWCNLGNALAMKSEYNNALSAFDKALMIDPVYGKALFGKAITLRNLDKPDEALLLANAILKMYKDENVELFKKKLILSSIDESPSTYTLDKAIGTIDDAAHDVMSRNGLSMDHHKNNASSRIEKICFVNDYNDLKDHLGSLIAFCSEWWYIEENENQAALSNQYKLVYRIKHNTLVDASKRGLRINYKTYPDIQLQVNRPLDLCIFEKTHTIYGMVSFNSREKHTFILLDATTSIPQTTATITPDSHKYAYDIESGAATFYRQKEIDYQKVIVIPDYINGLPVRSIAEEVHWHEDTFETIQIGNSVIDVGKLAFFDCRNLRTVKIGSNVRCIGDEAFSACNNIEQYEVSIHNQTYCAINGVLFSKDTTVLVRMPASRTGTFHVPNGVREIASDAFWGSALSKVVLPPTLKSIRSNAFTRARNKCEIFIPNSVEKMEFDAVENGFWSDNSNYLISAPHGSYAEQYAKENRIDFICLND